MGEQCICYDVWSWRKKKEDDKDDHVYQRVPREAIEGKHGLFSPSRMHLYNKNARKRTGSKEKK